MAKPQHKRNAGLEADETLRPKGLSYRMGRMIE